MSIQSLDDYLKTGMGSSAEHGMDNWTNKSASDNLFSGIWDMNQDSLGTKDPYLQGHARVFIPKSCVFMEKLGKWELFKNLVEKNFKGFTGLADLQINTEQIAAGYNGNEYAVATGIQKDNTTFNIKLQEMAGSPVRKSLESWVTGMKDPDTGLSHYHGLIADGTLEYSARNHTCEILYVVLDPSHSKVEFAALITNAFPTKVPLSFYDYNQNDHGLTEIDIEFRGTLHIGKAVMELAQSYIEDIKNMPSYYNYAPSGTLSNTTPDASQFTQADAYNNM